MDWRRGTLAALGLLVLLLVADAARLPERWVFPRSIVAHDLVTVADAHGRARMVNVVLAMALREAADGAGAESPSLELPDEYAELLAVPQDEFAGRAQATLNPSLVRPFLGGRVSTVEYDPVLDEHTVLALDSMSEVIRYPREVSVVPPRDAGEGPEYRLYVDPGRRRVFLLPSHVGDSR